MAVESLSWALNDAPVDEPSAAFILVGLCNHGDPDGRGIFPSVARLAWYTRLSERTVREYLDVLEEARVIIPGDPQIAAAYIKRADRRPQVWDVDTTLRRDNPEHLERFHVAMAKLQVKRAEQRERSRAKKKADDGVQPQHPEQRGATVAADGVQPLPERGATVAPEPSKRHHYEPSTTSSRSARGGSTRRSPNRGNSGRDDVVDVSQSVALFDVPQPEPAPKRARSVNPDTPYNLAGFFADAMRDVDDFSVRFGAVNHAALAKHIKDWLARGVTPQEIRSMATLYASDARHRTKDRTPWLDFINRRVYLAAQIREQHEATAWNAVGSEEFNAHWGVSAEDYRDYATKRTWGEIKADLIAEDPSLADRPESDLLDIWQARMEALRD